MTFKASDPLSLGLPFDLSQNKERCAVKFKCIDQLIRDLSHLLPVHKVLDVGCGIGDLSEYLATSGLEVTGIDARALLIREAKRRHTQSQFEVRDIEISLADMGQFDLVICLELLEHLESPVRALQNLSAVTRNCIFIGSYLLKCQEPILRLIEEGWEEDKALRGIACVPSEMALVQLLRACGFEYVYKRRCKENHGDGNRDCQWVELLGSRLPLSLSQMELISTVSQDLKTKVKRDKYLFRASSREKFRILGRWIRGQMPMWVRLPRPLPFGGWWLDGNDHISNRMRECLSRPEVWRFMSSYLKPGMHALDIYAHGGFYTVLMGRCVGSEGKVVAFELFSEAVRRLQLHLILNLLGHVIIQQIAFSDNIGDTTLFLPLEGTAEVYLLRLLRTEHPVRKVRLKTITLDSYISQERLGRLDFIKLDVKGGELCVLKGAKTTLKLLRPVVLCEVWDKRTTAWGYPASEIYSFLKDLQYQWFHITPEAKLLPAPPKTRYNEILVAIPEESIPKVEYLIE